MQGKELANLRTMNLVVANAAQMGNWDELVSYPERIGIVPTLRCNFACRYCSQDHKATEELGLEELKKLEPVLPFVSTLKVSGGEPLVYPHLEELVTMAGRHEMDFSINSNGLLLGDRNRKLLLDHASQVKFSIDAGTAQTYSWIRNADFNRILDGMAALTDERARRGQEGPEVSFSFVAMRRNVEELDRLVMLASRMGVARIEVYYLRVRFPELIEESLFADQERSDRAMLAAREVGLKVGVDVRLPNLFSQECRSSDKRRACNWPWTYLGFHPTGAASICCGGGGTAGNLKTDGFYEIWNHPERKAVRRTVNTDHPLPKCVNCMESGTIRADNPRSHFGGLTDLALEKLGLGGDREPDQGPEACDPELDL
jgi:MoaA/NifB/PqqE/SkfB family radical SAM enzyme